METFSVDIRRVTAIEQLICENPCPKNIGGVIWTGGTCEECKSRQARQSLSAIRHSRQPVPTQDEMADKQEEAVTSVSKAAELFSTDFHKNITSKVTGNFVSSALSAHTVLAMAAYGADCTTAETMRKYLHLPDNDDESLEGFQGFIDTINNVQNVVLKIANKIYASAELSIKNKFKEITGTHFRSESDTLNFDQNYKSAQVINSWCVEKTNGKIAEIISPDDINCDTGMILLNAVYFKANWRRKFYESRTSPETFYIDKSTTIDVPMMHITKKMFYRTLETASAKCIALPYENEDMFMVIIVPDEIDGLANVEKNLDNIELNHKDMKTWRIKTILSLPKFKIKSTLELNDHLSELGLAEIFTRKANFSKICDKPINVSKVVQKAFVEVNEDGCEAAAVTGIKEVFMCLEIPPPSYPTMLVNRPFFYKIVYEDITLFSGHVVNPLLTS